jgi:hypothetical protein
MKHSLPEYAERWTCVVPRFRGEVTKWLKDGQCRIIGDSLASGFVTHPSLRLGKGGSAEVFIGFRASDGTDMALKKFVERVVQDDDEVCEKRTEWEREVEALRQRAAIPGVVGFYGHYTHAAEDADEGETKITNVIALELMEGTVTELVVAWNKTPNVSGSAAHLCAVRYVVSDRHLERAPGGNPLHFRAEIETPTPYPCIAQTVCPHLPSLGTVARPCVRSVHAPDTHAASLSDPICPIFASNCHNLGTLQPACW